MHVWQARLDLPEAAIENLAATLSADERARAGRYGFPIDRNRFIAARGQLRELLGHYLDLAPGRLRFVYGRHGKPALAVPSGTPPIEFNVAHSGSLALFAVTRGRAVGIDIELLRPDLEVDELAGHFFSREECAELRRVPLERRLEAFGACWTRKEAFLKARGDGLNMPLDGFQVSLLPGERARLVAMSEELARGETRTWTLAALETEPGYAAAVAVAGEEWAMVCRLFSAAGTASG